eukprot:m.66497 g.66497  ORF g.66497 m.66497 type:complete len:736 (+) comp13594_c1_seq1:301-2508(+)
MGTFRRFLIDITEHAKANSSKTSIELRVTRPQDRSLPPSNHDTDLAISFVDWAPMPPDQNMGVFQPAMIQSLTTGMFVDSVAVAVMGLDGTGHTNLSVAFTVHSFLTTPQSTLVSVTIGSAVTAEMPLMIPANRSLTVTMNHTTTAALQNVSNIQLWWPWRYGPQTMTPVTLTITNNDTILANTTRELGLRQVTSLLDENGYRLFFINGKRFMVYGAAYSPHLFLKYNATSDAIILTATRDMGLNTIRLEGKMMTDEFFDQTTALGLMVLPGWCCCDAWQHWQYWGEAQMTIAADSLRTQLRRLRAQASVLGFLYGSDEAPPAQVEQLYLQVAAEEGWTLPFISAASNTSTEAGGPTGVKMDGPYAWVPPVYWYQGLEHPESGGAFGFSTEISPGAAPVLYSSAQNMFSPDELWPINDVWDYHCGSELGLFTNLRFFLPPFTARMGNTTSAKEFLFKSQLMAYEAERAMFEAYSIYKYRNSTGVVQWMLNNPFPSLIWHLIDFYHARGGGYYGTKTALARDTHAVFDPYTGSISVVRHNVLNDSDLLSLSAEIWSVSSTRLFATQTTLFKLFPDSVYSAISLQDELQQLCLTDPYTTFLVHLYLNQSSTTVDESTYWYSCQPDVLDWNNSTFYITYCSNYANYTALCSMPTPTISSKSCGPTCVEVANDGTNIAFFVQLQVQDQATRAIQDEFWFDDNFLTLYPLQRQQLHLNMELPASSVVVATALADYCSKND